MAAPTSENQASESNTTRRRIVVVDDMRAAGRLFGKMLEALGQQADSFDDPHAALKAIIANPPDVVMSDIGMPEMNGIELAQRIRQTPGLDTLPLVAVTGYGEHQDLADAKAAGFNFHLLKPIGLADLEKLLASLPTPE